MRANLVNIILNIIVNIILNIIVNVLIYFKYSYVQLSFNSYLLFLSVVDYLELSYLF